MGVLRRKYEIGDDAGLVLSERNILRREMGGTGRRK